MPINEYVQNPMELYRRETGTGDRQTPRSESDPRLATFGTALHIMALDIHGWIYVIPGLGY